MHHHPRKEFYPVFWILLFAWVILDSLVIYLLKHFVAFPINAVLPVLVILAFIFESQRCAKYPPHLIWPLAIFFIGAGIGVAIGGEPAFKTLKSFVTAGCAFIIGYKAVASSRNLSRCLTAVALVGVIYALVCFIAVLGVLPEAFPVSYLEGFQDGLLVRRVEITVDQNYQIYYLFPLLMGVVGSSKKWLQYICFAALAAALYVEIKMESRSGMLLLGGGFVAVMLTPVWMGQKLGLLRLFALLLLIPTLIILNMGSLQDSYEVLVRRFSSDNLGTFWGRVESAKYLWVRIFNPLWWVPHGNQVFVNEYGGLPHHAPTFVFLQAGILGLGAWFYLVFHPVIKGAKALWQKKIDVSQSLIWIGALVSLLAALSLGGVFEQAWLWGGACHGLFLSRNRNLHKNP